MSLANIRRLMQEDTTLRLPATAAWSAASRRVITIIATDNHTGGIGQIAMLHINTQGKIQWSLDRVGTSVAPSPTWCKEHGVGATDWHTKASWSKGWAQAVRHISNEHIVVAATSDTFDIIRAQYIADSHAPPAPHQRIVLKEWYRKNHPHRSGSLMDMAKFYQVPLDPENPIKARVVTYAKILENMVNEGIPLLEPTPSALSTEPHWVEPTLDAARKLTLKTANTASTPMDFFDALARLFPLAIAHNKKRVLGFAINIGNHWYKGSDLHRTLAWPTLLQEKKWTTSMDDVARLDFLYNNPDA